MREEVLYHLARESAAARRVKRGAVGVKATRPPSRWPREVVSDIDDTLLCSGARFPAGHGACGRFKGVSSQDLTIGCLAMLLARFGPCDAQDPQAHDLSRLSPALQRARQDTQSHPRANANEAMRRSWTPEDPCCNLAFLSARPHIYKESSRV